MNGELHKKRVAVIGAGASGLAAIKSCVDEGLQPVCFERVDEVGGLWYYTDHVRPGQGCVMKSTTMNTCKEMMCFSDFPPAPELPNFMNQKQVWTYFNKYKEHFDLQKYIHFNTEVVSVSQANDFDQSGCWTIKTRNHMTGKDTTNIFDGVLVCTGHHAEKHSPKFPGLESFEGEVVHSHDYKERRRLEGKKVLIIGIGNSGGDLAVELAPVCKVLISTRRGTWIRTRVTGKGLPMDMVNTNRWKKTMRSLLPTSFYASYVAKKLNQRIDHDLCSLRPVHSPFDQVCMVNDDLGTRISCGSVTVKTNVQRVTSRAVEFADGSVEDDVDVIILATGYVFGFPFIDTSILDVQENKIELYKFVFPPDLAHPTLAIIGCIQPLGAIMPISEMQSRLAAGVIKGSLTLPSRDDMWSDVRRKQEELKRQYVESQRHTIMVDFLPFMDELAELVGCKPNIGQLMMRDPRLAIQVMFGPCSPYQFRLTGPGAWTGARDAILTQWQRVVSHLHTRQLPSSDIKSTASVSISIATVVFLGVLLFFCQHVLSWR
ncbi:flavin-containing monooxygenase 5-like [Littorina saxatilis]|uniref:Flavin-containing monooxygenase n=1 Tax=Littorina saxatilis TaxID=31220 RepID=A0AAN9G4Q1_9CAEN